MEVKMRSAIKSIIWRIMGVLILGGVTYFYTRHWVQTTVITFLHHGIFLFVFYAHERIWLLFKRPAGEFTRSIAKMFTYETLCGNIILGLITFTVTGDWKQMTAITVTYIGIKHVVYVWNELIWKRIKIGQY